MPLSTPTVSRERLHVRRISYEGYRRDDGLFDIDARLVDTKDQDFELLTGTRAAGEPVHDMAGLILVPIGRRKRTGRRTSLFALRALSLLIVLTCS